MVAQHGVLLSGRRIDATMLGTDWLSARHDRVRFPHAASVGSGSVRRWLDQAKAGATGVARPGTVIAPAPFEIHMQMLEEPCSGCSR
jgi:hypothetical protein